MLTIFFLLSCAFAVSLGRRQLYDDAALPPPMSLSSPPFFPLDSSLSPPPSPTFAVFPTFPANISALVLPRSSEPHPSSRKLVVPALSAFLAVATAIGLSLFLYNWRRGKRQKSHFRDSESCTSYEEPIQVTNNFSVAATSSSAGVFYLHGGEETGTCFVNSESSPEIRPLPPLPPRGFQDNSSYVAEEEEEEEEEEEFFSPLASLPASETSSPSREGEGICSSSSSSRWVSPARSFSITMSPLHPRFSQNLYSPSPERLGVWKDNRRMFSFWNQNLGFPRISSASTSPDRVTIRTPDAYAPSSVSTSPDGFLQIFLDSSPRPVRNDFSRNVKSVLLSSDSASSRRDYLINIGESFSGFGRRQQSQAAAPPTRPPPLVPPSHPFKLNNEIGDTFFIANSSNQRGLSCECDLPNLIKQKPQVLDPLKAQNITTLLQLLPLATKDICQALLNGDADTLGAELLLCLSRLAPSEEEGNKLKSYSAHSVNNLAPSERFLKELLHVPFGFKRVDALLYVANFHSEIQHLRRSFNVVQTACEELRNSTMFSVLLEAILRTGSKMNVTANSCDAHKLDNLLKLVEVKGFDGKSSLLHFVVQQVIKSEGTVKGLDSSLEGIRNLSSELVNVKKLAYLDFGALRNHVLKLYQGMKNIKELLLVSEESGDKFRETMARFLEIAAGEIEMVKTQERSTFSVLKEVAEHFHGDTAEEGQTLKIFMIVRDFLSILENVCNEIVD